MLQSSLQERTGTKVYCVPEAATLLVTGGLEWKNADTSEKTVEYQLALLRTQIALEDQFFSIAQATGKPALIVCDRGTMDGRAYTTEAQFNEILRKGGFTLSSLRDERYDAVMFLVSAAIGAESHYNLDNPARFEDVAGAEKADLHLRTMYIGHPRLKLIDNSSSHSFSDKMERALDYVYEVIGHRKPKHRTRRYLIGSVPAAFPIPTEQILVVITILAGSTTENIRFVMKRQQGETRTHILTAIARQPAGERTQSQHTISQREYDMHMLQRDPSRVDVVKVATSMTYNGTFMELSVFREPIWCRGRAFLYVDCDSDCPPKAEAWLPSWLNVMADTTGKVEYSSWMLSRQDANAFPDV